MTYTTEPGADGLPQSVIPGAEALPLPQMQLAHSCRLKTSDKPQKPANIGLFDDNARAQLDLFG